MRDYLALFIQEYMRPPNIEEPPKLTKPATGADEPSFVGFDGNPVGYAPNNSWSEWDKSIAMLAVIGKDPDAWFQLTDEICERAAIMEFDGGLGRSQSDELAEQLTLELWLELRCQMIPNDAKNEHSTGT